MKEFLRSQIEATEQECVEPLKEVSQQDNRPLAKVRRVYAFLAYLSFNCILATVLLDVLLWPVFWTKDAAIPISAGKPAVDQRVNSYREKFTDFSAYTRMSKDDVVAMLDKQDAMGSIGIQYEPWVQFRNPKFTGRFISTDERDSRVTRRPQSRPGKPMRVYLFGGSTTFGWGMDDEHTIASYLQEALEKKFPNRPILLKNFGQPFYYSSQEILVLQSLLKDGDIPDLAVFIDGGNDTAQLALQQDVPIFTPAMQRLWHNRTTPQVVIGGEMTLSGVPMMRLARAVSRRLSPSALAGKNPEQVDRFPPHLL